MLSIFIIKVCIFSTTTTTQAVPSSAPVYIFPGPKSFQEFWNWSQFQNFAKRLKCFTDNFFLILFTKRTFHFQYLTKQTAVLRDVNDSRLKIYEQLEVSISELEVANKKLSDENNADKAMIKMWVLLFQSIFFSNLKDNKKGKEKP